ncbi:hypothetical protein NC653_037783 [Populus alba x Populus x berolinensis]|uniref:Uncharacterized protein n=1 Tax=Populus alba x Populus x berolinensis TaxID=444605 RepID=A0AAD6LHS9_9ROSI|nr:hypothetical protein NC653_037783 [Populus alba x Populus x berolinensis]
MSGFNRDVKRGESYGGKAEHMMKEPVTILCKKLTSSLGGSALLVWVGDIKISKRKDSDTNGLLLWFGQ